MSDLTPQLNSGIRWSEVFVRLFMVVIHTVLFGVMLLLWYGMPDARVITGIVGLIYLPFVLFVWYLFIKACQVIWQNPRLSILEDGLRIKQRGQEDFWKWEQLTRYEVVAPFSFTFIQILFFRHGLFVIYAGETPVVRITALMSHPVEVSQSVAERIDSKGMVLR